MKRNELYVKDIYGTESKKLYLSNGRKMNCYEEAVFGHICLSQTIYLGISAQFKNVYADLINHVYGPRFKIHFWVVLQIV